MTPFEQWLRNGSGITITDNDGRMRYSKGEPEEGQSNRIRGKDDEDDLAGVQRYYDSIFTPDASGRMPFGSAGRAYVDDPLHGFVGGGNDWTSAKIGGKDYLQTGFDMWETYGDDPQIGPILKQLGVTGPNYDPQHGYITSPEVAKAVIPLLEERNGGGHAIFGRKGALQAFSQTIGLAMGASSLISALGNFPFQSLAGSLFEHAAGAGGSFTDIMSHFGLGDAVGAVDAAPWGVNAQAGNFWELPGTSGIDPAAVDPWSATPGNFINQGTGELAALGASPLASAGSVPSLPAPPAQMPGTTQPVPPPGVAPATDIPPTVDAPGLLPAAAAAATAASTLPSLKDVANTVGSVAQLAGAGAGIIGAVNGLTGGGGGSGSGTTNEMTALQMQIARQQAAQAADQFDFYRTTYRPVETALAGDALNAGSLESQESRAAQAGTTVTQQFANARAAEARRQSALGIKPDSGNSLSSFNQHKLAEAASSAGASNTARQDERTYGTNVRLATAGLGRGVATNALAAGGEASRSAHGAVNSAVAGSNLQRQQNEDIGHFFAAGLPRFTSALSGLFSGSDAPAQSTTFFPNGTNSSGVNPNTTRIDWNVDDAYSWKRGGLVRPRRAHGYTNGGHVRGEGTGTSDSIPVLVDGKTPGAISNGEYVVRASSVRKLGVRNLDHMNRTGELPMPKRRAA